MFFFFVGLNRGTYPVTVTTPSVLPQKRNSYTTRGRITGRRRAKTGLLQKIDCHALHSKRDERCRGGSEQYVTFYPPFSLILIDTHTQTHTYTHTHTHTHTHIHAHTGNVFFISSDMAAPPIFIRGPSLPVVMESAGYVQGQIVSNLFGVISTHTVKQPVFMNRSKQHLL